MKHKWFLFFFLQKYKEATLCAYKITGKESSNIFLSKFHVWNINLFFRCSLLLRCPIDICLVRNIQPPARCAESDATYNIMYAGSMYLKWLKWTKWPRQLCYNSNKSMFCLMNFKKERLISFQNLASFENFWTFLKAS